MRIGFDAKRAFSNYTGLGNYSRSTLKILTEQFPSNEYFLYTPRVPDESQIRFLDLPHHAQFHIRIPKSFFFELFPSLWRRVGITSDIVQDKLDIYHGLSHELPHGIDRTKIRSIVTIHDLIFLRYPEYYKAADRKIYRSKFESACKAADKIIAISEQTKRDLVHYFSIPGEKISVVYQSCAALFKQELSQQKREEVRLKYQLPESYMLNVGTIETRKNALLILKAMVQTRSELPLVIIGRKTPYISELQSYITQHKLGDRVQFIHDVSFADLPAIYQASALFIYPSRFEGFGIPIVEALHSYTPVIAATGSCLEEAGGEYTEYVHPDDAGMLAEKIDLILSDPAKQQEMIRKGKEYAGRFEPEVIAADLMKVYASV